MAKKARIDNPIYGSEKLDPLYSNPQYYGDSGSQYDRVSLMPLDEQRAQAQTGWDSFGNIAGRLVGRTGLSVIESAGMLGYGLPKALLTGDLNSLFDNELSQGFKSLDEALVQKTPFYQTEAEKNASLFSTEYLTSTPFWGNLIGEGGGFVLGAMASGNLIGRGISSAGKLANSMGMIASDAEKIREVASAAKSGESVAEKLIATRRNIKAQNLASYYTQKIGGNMYEAGVEARGVKEEILRAKMEEFEKTNLPGAVPTEEQKAIWESIATTYSNASFGLNLGLLMIDGLNIGRFLKGYKSTNKAVNALRDAGKYTEKGILGKTFDRAGTILGGGLAEAAQEGGQFVTEKMTADMARTQKTADATRSFNDYFISTIKGLEQTFGTKEGQESMLAGFLLAAPFNIPTAISQGTVDKHGIEAMNNNATGKTFQALLKHNHDNFIEQVGEKKDKYAEMNSHILHEDLQRDGFYKYVKSRDDAGRFDDVLDDIGDLKRMDINAFKEGYGEHYTEVTRQETLNDLEKQARYYQNTKEEIEAAFSNHQNKEALIEGSVKINNLTDRINRLDSKIANGGISELIRTNLQTDKLNLINERAAEELKLGEYLSERKTLAEDELEKEAAAEIEEPEDLTENKNKTKPKNKKPVVKDFEKGDEVSYKNSKAIVEAVKEDETGNRILTIVQNNGTKVNVDETSLDNSAIEEEESNEDWNSFETQNTKSKDGLIEADIFDEDGKATKWMSLNPEDHENSPHVNASDLGLIDFGQKEKNISEDLKDTDFHNSLKINATAANRIKNDILDSGVDNYSYEYKKEKDSNGDYQHNVYAKKGNGKAVKVGFFLNFNKNFASNGKKDNITIEKFFKQYIATGTEQALAKAPIINTISKAQSVLLAEDELNITDQSWLATKILNSYENLTLSNIIGSNYANRWKVNDEFVVAKYSKGSYTLIGDVSDENEKIFNEAIKKEYNKNSLGAQFIIMVKRPSKYNVYNFINLKGKDVDAKIKQSLVDRLEDPKVDKEALVQELNEQIFIGAKGKSFKVSIDETDTIVPVHLYFDTDYNGDIVVKREPKVVEGKKPDVEIPRKYQKSSISAKDAIMEYGYERIPVESVKDIDDIKNRVVTNVDKKLWDSYFSFSHSTFLRPSPTISSQTPDSSDNKRRNSKVDAETANRVIKEIINNKKIIKGLTKDGKLVEIDSGEEYEFYYNTKTKETYQRATSISSEGKTSSDEELKKTSTGLGNKTDKIFRDFFNPKNARKKLNYEDYDIVSEDKKREFDKFLKQLETLKSNFIRRGETVYANGIVLYDNEFKVAGTVDVITVDKYGNFRIYDVKTMRGNQFEDSYADEEDTYEDGSKVEKYYSNLYGKSNYQSHTDQLSIYRILLNNTHGVLATQLAIIPIELDYKTGDTKTKKLNLLEDYIYKLDKLDEVGELYLTESAATEEVEKAKVNYSAKQLLKKINEVEVINDDFILSLGMDLEQLYNFVQDDLENVDPDELKTFMEDYEDDAITGSYKFFLPRYINSLSTTTKTEKPQPATQEPEDSSKKEPEGATAPQTSESLFGSKPLFDVPKDNGTSTQSTKEEEEGYKPFDEYTETEQQFIEQANQDVKRILNVDIKLEQNSLNFGSFRNGLIYLASKAPKGTLWHEAFHGIFSILTPNEKARVLNIAERVFGKPTAEDLQSLRKIYQERGYKRISDSFLYKKILEEKVADLFQDYMNEKPTTFFGKFFEMLKRLVNYFLDRTSEPSFAAFFDEIYSGKYKAVNPAIEKIESFKPISNASGSEQETLLAQLTSYYANRGSFYKEENSNLGTFVRVMLNKIRIGHDAKIKDDYENAKKNLANLVNKKVYTVEQALKQEKAIRERIQKTYVSGEIDGKEYFYPEYLSKKYEDDIIAEVLDYNDFKKVNDSDMNQEDEKERYYEENEFEKSIHSTPAGQAIRNAMRDMAIVDKYFEIKPINAVGIINNLTFTLNGISKNEMREKLESLISSEEDGIESDFSKSLRVILDEYNRNATFRRQFQTAFDRSFAQAIKAVSSVSTRESGKYLTVENNKDHIQQQLIDWETQNSFDEDSNIRPLENGTIEEKNSVLLQYLGIKLEPDVYKEKNTQKLLTALRKKIFNVNSKGEITGSKFLFTDKENKVVLEDLAKINIKYRLDLGELNFKNADGKPMSSIINNSYIINKLNAVTNKHLVKEGESFKKKWGIFIGTKFGDKSSDYKGIDPKAYFLTQLMMYSNREGDNKNVKPYYAVQQPSDKNTVFVFEGKRFTGNPALIAQILREERERQDAQMEEILAVLEEINALEISEEDKISLLTEGYHYVKKQTIGEAINAYERVLNGEINRLDPSVPRAFKYNNIPYINEGDENGNPLSAEQMDNMDDDFYLQLVDDMIARDLQYENADGQVVPGNIKDIIRTFGISNQEIMNIAGIKKENIDQYLEQFLVNQYLNRLLILSEVNPDLSQFKNSSAATKRAAGTLASGPDHHDPELATLDENGNVVSDDFRFGIIPDRKKIFNSSVKQNDKAETLDAQGFELISERRNRLLRLGRASEKSSKKNKFNDELHLDYLILTAYLDDNRDLIKKLGKGGSPLKVDKTVGYGEEFYLKTSMKVLARAWSSDFSAPGQTRTLTHKTKVFEGIDPVTEEEIYRDVVYTETYEAFQDTYNGKWYLPIPGREVEWNLMNEMQKGNMSTAFAESAVKKGAKNIARYFESNPENPVQNPARIQLSQANTFSYFDYRLQQETPPDTENIGDGSQAIQQIDSNFDPTYVPENQDVNNERTIDEIRKDNDNLLVEIKEYQKELYLKGFDTVDINGKKYCAFVNYIVSALDSSKATDRMKDFFQIDSNGNFKFSTSLPMMEKKFEEMVMAYINNNIASHKVPGEKMVLMSSEFYRPMRDKNGNILTTYEVEELRKEDPNIYDKLNTSEELKAPSIEKDGQKYAEVVVSEEYLSHLGITIKDWVRLKNSENEEDKAVFDKLSTFMGYRIPTQARHSMLPCKIVDFMPTHFGSVVVLPAEVTKLSGSDYDVDSLFAQRYSVYKDKDGNIRLADNTEKAFRKYLFKNKLAKEYLSEMDKEEKANLYMKIGELEDEINPLLTQLSEVRDRTLDRKGKVLPFTAEEDYVGKGMESMAKTLSINKQIDSLKAQIEEVKAQIDNLEDMRVNEIKKLLGLEDNFNPNTVYNDMLDNRMLLLTSHKGRIDINFPAQNHFKILHEDIFSQLAHFQDDEDRNPAYATFPSFFTEWLKAYAGKGSISGSANVTKDHAFLQKNAAEISSKLFNYWNRELNIKDNLEEDIDIAVTKDGEIIIIKDNVSRPKFDTLSNFVSQAVDNGNDQTLYKYNLNSQTMAEAAVMGSLGFGRNRIATFFLNPVVKAISGKLIIEDTLLNGTFVDKIKVVETYINRKFKNIPERQLTQEDLLKALSTANFERTQSLLELSEEDIRNLEGEDKDLIEIQANIARMYLEFSNISKDYFTVNTIVNYNKEVGRYGYDVYKMQNAINTLYSDKFSISNIQDIEQDNDNNSVIKNTFIHSVNNILKDLTRIIEENMLSYNTTTKTLLNSIVKSTDKFGQETSSLKFQQAMKREFMTFLSVKIFAHRYSANLESKEKTGNKKFGSFFGSNVFDKDVIRGTKVISQFEKVQGRLRDKYSLGRALKVSPATETYPFPRIVIESYANIDPENEKKLINDFQDMLGDTDQDIKLFANMILQHIAAHDNFKYVSGSLVRIIKPMFFDSLNQVYKGDKHGTIGLEDLFNYKDKDGNGLSMQEFRATLSEMLGSESKDITYDLVKEFGKFFFLDGRNRQFVKYKNTFFDKENSKTEVIKKEVKIGKNKTVERTTGYLITVEPDSFIPDFFQTVLYPKEGSGRTKPKYYLYTRVTPNIGRGEKEVYRYELVEQPMTIKGEPNKYNTKYYQLKYSENIELLNEAIEALSKTSTKKKSRLEEMEIEKARTELAKRLEETEDDDKFYQEEEGNLYSGEINNEFEVSREKLDIEVVENPTIKGKLSMQPDNIEKIKNGEKTITNRTEELKGGIYEIPDGSYVRLLPIGYARVVGNIIRLEEGSSMDKDYVAQSEGFDDWNDFEKNNKYSANFINGKQGRYLYSIEPVKISNKKTSNVTNTKTQKVTNNPTSGIIDKTLNDPTKIPLNIIQAMDTRREGAPVDKPEKAPPSSMFPPPVMTEATLKTIDDNHKELIANFDSYSEELSKIGFNSVEQLEALQDPIERRKIYKLICS
jgi:hypothetical protein